MFNPGMIRFKLMQSVKSMSGLWYRNIQHIANGGNASTYLVRATSGPNNGVLFALKIFTNIAKKKRRERFIGEVNFLQKCDHPAIMKVYDQGIFKVEEKGMTTKDFPFVIAEYLPNTLRDFIYYKSINNIQKLNYSIQLVSALRYLSMQLPPVIHRDIKPTNIFIKGDSCVLGDFGLMKFEDLTTYDDFDFFSESSTPGMPFKYRTPDLINFSLKKSHLTTETDIFQLGAVLVELFSGVNPINIPIKMLDPIKLSKGWHITGKYGSKIAGVLNDMMEMKSADRPSLDEILDSLQRVFWNLVDDCHKLEGSAF